MTLDFLCPGDWMDSYESRIVNPNSLEDKGGYYVDRLADVLNACSVFLDADKHYFELFSELELYIDGHFAARMGRDKVLVLRAPCDVLLDGTIFYPFGMKDMLFDVRTHKYLGRA